MKRISILGSTGSIGRNCLEVVRNLKNQLSIRYLSTYSNIALLIEQINEFHPCAVAICGMKPDAAIEKKMQQLEVEVGWGNEGLLTVASRSDTDVVVNALVGAAGLLPTLKAIEAGKTIALANKETLVTAGELVMQKALQKNVSIIPIDSEHSALLQCLQGERHQHIRRLILTASGGPFWQRPGGTFRDITVEEALKHPNWNMGRKITIDSATMMNKGLELIEAHWLFQVPEDRINIVIHPQSIIHSMVEFVDGSIKAQMGLPDMKIPIQYALTYPDRDTLDASRLDFARLQQLQFALPDTGRFPSLRLARNALRTGGTACAVMNAANEAAVALFLNRRISFDSIPASIEMALTTHEVLQNPSLPEISEADRWARNYVNSLHRAGKM
ncbi:1-deoxy-D-xylulose-5-phosphate reductoisomerase [candidate division KSB1 bacterium]|nr:1-deoxy-D-xylulose-5-phosphate reductoisomerase [candidate division KSB1 bacterium]